MRTSPVPQYETMEYTTRVLDGDFNPKPQMLSEENEQNNEEVVDNAAE